MASRWGLQVDGEAEETKGPSWLCTDASQGVQLKLKVTVKLRTPWKVKEFVFVNPLCPRTSYLLLQQRPHVLIKYSHSLFVSKFPSAGRGGNWEERWITIPLQIIS